MKGRLFSLRTRLMALVLLAIIPAFGLILYSGLETRHQAALAAQTNALRLARLVAKDEEGLVEGADQLLTALARLPAVRTRDAAACNDLFADLKTQNLRYANFVAATPDGEAFCSAEPLNDSVNFADRPWFQRALESRDFVVGEYVIGRITDTPLLPFAHAVVDDAGQVEAVVMAGMDLTSLNRLAGEVALPAGSVLILLDRQGTILTRYPDPEPWIGKTLPEIARVEAILSSGNPGTTEMAGMDGIPRLYALMPTPDDLYVAIGIPTAVAYAPIRQALVINLLGLSLVAVLALTAAWVGGKYFITRRVDTLLRTTQRLAAGDLGARTELTYGVGELSQLARSFDDMAASLERQTREREQTQIELRKMNRTIQAISACNQILGRAEDESGLLSETCRMMVEIGGYRMTWVGYAENDPEKTVRPVAHAGDEAGYLKAVTITGDENEHGYGPSERAIRTGEPVAAQDIASDGRFAPWREAATTRAYAASIALPLKDRSGKPFGVLNVYAGESRIFDADEIQLLSGLADDLAYGVVSLRERGARQAAEDQLRRESAIREAVNRVFHEALTCETQQEVAQTCLTVAEELTGSAFGFIGEINQAGRFDTIALSDPGWAACKVPNREATALLTDMPIRGLWGMVLHRETSLIINDPTTHADRVGTPAGHPELTALLCVPLKRAGATVGMIALANKVGGYNAADQAAIEALSTAFVEALTRKRIEQAEREQRTLAEALRDTTASLAGTLDLDEVLERILGNVEQVVPCDASTIMFIENGYGRVVRSRGYAERGLDSVLVVRLPIGELPNLRQMIETAEPVIIADTQQYPHWARLPETSWIRSYVGAPICVRGAVVGLLNLDSATPGFFTPLHAERLKTFAGQAGVAIENARLYASLQETNVELHAALRAKDEMIQNVSHELRSPLTIISGYTELFAEASLGALTPAQTQALSVMREQLNRLLFMVNRLLTLQSFSADKLQPLGLDLEAWLASTMEGWELRAARAAIRLDIDVAPVLPELRIDPDFFRQVIDNLLDNAVKFSPEGGSVTVRAFPQESDRQAQGWLDPGSFVIVTVADQGIGISQDKLGSIFERFYQVDSSSSRQFGGVGIGLALCKAIVEAHGGRIWAESAGNGQGSTFSIALPCSAMST